MILGIWAVIAIVVLLSALLIYMEHEWGFWLGGSTAVILIISYFSAGLLVRSPLVVLLPRSSNSTFDAMAITAVILLALALIAIAFLAGRRSASRKKQ
ncbi:MAG: hypothetical protein F9K29_20765 [Hyphomicrobiaceae bacterium]|nr:MAG: hypothetical protein F9K29_20765 [Hyphomicrobiaceae bacterium]